MTCICTNPGFCPRRNITLSKVHFQKCRDGTDQDRIQLDNKWKAIAKERERRKELNKDKPSVNDISRDSTTHRLWLEAHSYTLKPWNSIKAHKWYNKWIHQIPGKYQKEWATLTKKYPPDFSSNISLFNWFYHRHNDINISIGKHKVLYQDALASFLGKVPNTRPNLMISVATGTKFLECYNIIRPSLQYYADKINADLLCLVNTSKDWWGYEKFRIQDFLSLYERTLFVDSDLVITPNAPNVLDMVPADSIGLHNDWSCVPYWDREWMWEVKRKVCESQGWYNLPIQALYNSGFVVCSRNHEIWKAPDRPLPTHHCSEQFYFEQTIVRGGYKVVEFPVELNTQWWMYEFRRMMPFAQIIHMANSTDKKNDLIKAMDQYFYNYTTKNLPDTSNITSKWK